MFDHLISYRVSDLLFSVKIEEAGKNALASYQRIDSINELPTGLRKSSVLIVCDLTKIKPDLENLTKLAKKNSWKIIGYYPHVDKETETLARSLGVDYVVPRSAFQYKLVALLS
jgi:hypothetical protein